MQDEIFTMYFINGVAIFIQCMYTLMYHYNQEPQHEQLEYLRNKVCRLEKHILLLEQNLEELEETMYTKSTLNLSNSKMESFFEKRATEKQRQLEEFIEYDDE